MLVALQQLFALAAAPRLLVLPVARTAVLLSALPVLPCRVEPPVELQLTRLGQQHAPRRARQVMPSGGSQLEGLVLQMPVAPEGASAPPSQVPMPADRANQLHCSSLPPEWGAQSRHRSRDPPLPSRSLRLHALTQRLVRKAQTGPRQVGPRRCCFAQHLGPWRLV